jgi:hypothetical protein
VIRWKGATRTGLEQVAHVAVQRVGREAEQRRQPAARAAHRPAPRCTQLFLYSYIRPNRYHIQLNALALFCLSSIQLFKILLNMRQATAYIKTKVGLLQFIFNLIH